MLSLNESIKKYLEWDNYITKLKKEPSIRGKNTVFKVVSVIHR